MESKTTKDAIKLLENSEAYMLATNVWKNGIAHIALIKGGPKHGIENCADSLFHATKKGLAYYSSEEVITLLRRFHGQQVNEIGFNNWIKQNVKL